MVTHEVPLPMQPLTEWCDQDVAQDIFLLTQINIALLCLAELLEIKIETNEIDYDLHTGELHHDNNTPLDPQQLYRLEAKKRVYDQRLQTALKDIAQVAEVLGWPETTRLFQTLIIWTIEQSRLGNGHAREAKKEYIHLTQKVSRRLKVLTKSPPPHALN